MVVGFLKVVNEKNSACKKAVIKKENKMVNKKCFLENCTATIGDCENTECVCLKCFGKNKKNCELLQNEHKSKIQILICSRCKNFVFQK